MITILDPKTDEVVGWLSSTITDSHKDSINNEEIYSFVASRTEPHIALVSKRSRIIIPAEEGDYREFIVQSTRESTMSNDKEVTATGSFLDLNKLKIIKPQVLEGQTVTTAASYILVGVEEWQLGIVEYSEVFQWVIDKHLKGYEAIKEVARLSGLELRFRITTDGHTVTGRYIDFIKKKGMNRGKEITFGKDLMGITRRVHSERIVTSLKVIGPTKQNGTFIEVLVTNDAAYQNWNRKGKHLVDIYTPEVDVNISIADLTKIGEEELQKRIDAVVEYDIEAVALDHVLGYEHEIVMMGDTAYVKDEYFNPPLYLNARVMFIDRSIFNKTKKSYKLGEVIEYSKEDVMKVWRDLQKIYGVNIISDPEPPVGRKDLIWIKTGGPMDIAHTWNGTDWVAITPTNASQIGAETPEGARSKAVETYINTVASEKADNDNKYTTMYTNPSLVGSSKTNLVYAKDSYNAAHTNLTNSISLALVDGVTSIIEKEDVDAKYSAYRDSISLLTIRFEEATRAMETKKTEEASAAVLVEANDFTQAFANKKVQQSATEPLPPSDVGDLWIDISGATETPPRAHVWKRYNGTNWVNASATSIEELDGLLAANQIAIGAIKHEHIEPFTIDSGAIKNGAIVSAALADLAITQEKLAAGSVANDKIQDDAITALKIAAGQVQEAQLAVGAVTSGKILDGAIAEAKLAAGAVTVGKIGTGAVTNAKVAALAIDATKLASGAVTNDKILAGAVTALKIAEGEVKEAQLAVGAVTSFKISDDAVTALKIANDAVTSLKIAPNAITAPKIADNAVSVNKILDGAIAEAKLAAGSVTAIKVGTGAITNSKLADLAIDAAKLATGAVTTTKIANNAIDSSKIVDNAITQGKIAPGSVGTDQIETGAIQEAKMNWSSHLIF